MRIDKKDAAETIKDIVFPQRCPVCTDIIPLEKRISMRRQMKLYISSGSFGGKKTDSGSFGVKRPGVYKYEERESSGIFQYLYDGVICRECVKELSFIEAPFCIKCGKQLSMPDAVSAYGEDAGGMLCSDCKKLDRSFISCRCVLNYDEAASEIMARLKYSGKCEYAELISLIAADRLKGFIAGICPDILIPVPVHPERLRKRGYNQAELIAGGISRLTGIPLRSDILRRTKNTRASKELSRAERLINLQDAFEAICENADVLDDEAAMIKRAVRSSANGSSPGGSSTRALLIDDIYTTGATMEACAEQLLGAGISEVYGLCICAGIDLSR